MSKVLIGIAAILFVGFLWISGTYNGLVSADETVGANVGTVAVQEQRRFDVIRNAVATVQGYAAHERGTLTEVTRERTAAAQAQVELAREQMEQLAQASPEQLESNPDLQRQLLQASQSLSDAVGSFISINVEAYPNLRANENFLQLQAQIEGSENRVAVARRDVQTSTRDYNRRVRGFPGMFVASMTGFETRDYFEASEDASVAPTVDFSTTKN